MAALTFTTLAKNAHLDALIKGTSHSYNFNVGAPYARITNAVGTSLFGGASGTALSAGFSTPVQGVSVLQATALTPIATGTALNLEWWNGNSVQIATGTVSTTGGGGNLIVGSTSFVSGTPMTITSTFKIPLNNGGTLKFNQALVNSWANAILNNTNRPSMAVGGTITLYSGTQPTDADTAIGAQVALGSLTFVTGDYSVAGSGSSALAASKSITPGTTGTATWARWTLGALTIDGSVGTTGTDFVVSTTSLVSGTPMNLTAATLTMP